MFLAEPFLQPMSQCVRHHTKVPCRAGYEPIAWKGLGLATSPALPSAQSETCLQSEDLPRHSRSFVCILAALVHCLGCQFGTLLRSWLRPGMRHPAEGLCSLGSKPSGLGGSFVAFEEVLVFSRKPTEASKHRMSYLKSNILALAPRGGKRSNLSLDRRDLPNPFRLRRVPDYGQASSGLWPLALGQPLPNP